eukprot:CAMPEP_0185281260 /NCGR_PEP_ID=MMETSP1359-20130426/66622_1 /TAXON_ID=552665 /ORGANISM="Bigelowiella longifila, Strain CCMP242" /LENGTH=124 /DNA_ID=CAMNT_0027876679 /DNA_START=448 /DNA_END=822 /DNA_ORIENTATION=-
MGSHVFATSPFQMGLPEDEEYDESAPVKLEKLTSFALEQHNRMKNEGRQSIARQNGSESAANSLVSAFTSNSRLGQDLGPRARVFNDTMKEVRAQFEKQRSEQQKRLNRMEKSMEELKMRFLHT